MSFRNLSPCSSSEKNEVRQTSKQTTLLSNCAVDPSIIETQRKLKSLGLVRDSHINQTWISFQN